MKSINCPYCSRPPELVTGFEIYKKQRFEHLKFWLCRSCDAYVGCHKKHSEYSPEGKTPFGFLANRELRELRKIVHLNFDPLWFRKGRTYRVNTACRDDRYGELSKFLKIKLKECHISMFTAQQCGEALEFCGTYKV